MKKDKIAILIGATGLTGSCLLDLLLKDDDYKKIITFSRRALKSQSHKLESHIVDFSSDSWLADVKGDILFSALGTTLKTAGSQEKQYLVDYEYQYKAAKAASSNGVESYVLISAAYASSQASIFYSRMKGELDDAVRKLPIPTINILRPGLIFGDREEDRFGEKIAKWVFGVLSEFPFLKRYTPISGKQLAMAMKNAAEISYGKTHIYTLYEVIKLSDNS